MNDFVNAFLHKYPYQTLHELNLDWIISAMKELAYEMHNFEVANHITYAGDWNITKQYPAWSVVVKDGTTGYLSLKPVPAGVDITNGEYWVLIADFSAVIAGLGSRVSALESDVSSLTTEVRNNTWLDGKKVLWYGDSWGTTADNMVSQFISMYPTVTVTNRCIGGTAMSRMTFPGYEYNSGYQRITSEDLSGHDYIFIMYGVNDWQVSQKMRTKNPDEYEYIYCVEETIKYLKNNYPTLKPVFILESFCYASAGFGHTGLDGVNLCGCTQQAYINNCIDICDRYNIPYINLYDLVGVNRYNYTHYMRNDGGAYVHPTAALFKTMANIIYKGIMNTGKVYDGTWGGNIVESVIAENVMDYTSYLDTEAGIPNYPKRLVTTSDTHSLTFVDNIQDKMVVHITGYRDDTSSKVLGLYYDSYNVGGSNARVFLGNCSKAGYFDSYIEVDRKDLFAPCYLLDTGSMTIYGLECRILNGSASIQSEYPDATAGTDIIITDNVHPVIKDGVVHYSFIRFTAGNDIAAYTDIISRLPKSFANKPVYLIGYDQITDSIVHFYLYNGKIRNATALDNGHAYIISDFSYPNPV